MNAMQAGCVCAGAVIVALAGCSGPSQPGGAPTVPHSASPRAAAAPPSAATSTSSATPAAPAADASAAHGDAVVMQSINATLGDAGAYRRVFSQLQQGVRTGDKQAVAELVAYPLDVEINGKPHTIRNRREFIQSWNSIITPDIARVIGNQKFSDLFVNQKGVMFGDGQVWLGGICRDVACTSSDVRIITIQK